jgi:hypothetical protein
MSGGALAGIRVIELAQGVAGPFCGKLFADYGADVVKVEPPGTGDLTRGWGPFPGDHPDPEKSGLFFFLKRTGSVAIDVSVERGRALLLDPLAPDVLIENQLPRQMRCCASTTRRCVTPTQSRRHLITPYGQTGPYAGGTLRSQRLPSHGASHRYGRRNIKHGTRRGLRPMWSDLGLAAVLGRDPSAAGTSMSRAPRQSRRRSWADRTSERSHKTASGSGARASVCRSAPRPRFFRARTDTSGCSLSSPASGTDW